MKPKELVRFDEHGVFEVIDLELARAVAGGRPSPEGAANSRCAAESGDQNVYCGQNLLCSVPNAGCPGDVNGICQSPGNPYCG
jgi:hypothetical protein